MNERGVERLLNEMTLDEKAALTAGSALFSMTGVERLGIVPPTVTDGPNGARGSALFGLGEQTAACVPCGSALGATWNPDLIESVGGLLGDEARTKHCRALLAPTVNLHRSPLAGRNFECYSEDPLLSGKAAAAFVRGVQSRGVITTVKHFAGNDAEFERQTINSVIDERSLRELYLVPFEIAVREGRALGIMTAYNRLNGCFCSEHHELITEILRDEWGFDGIVMTDWYSGGSTLGAAHAGLDIEMPGPGGRFFGAHLADAVRRGDVDSSVVDDQARRLLATLARVGALRDPPPGDEQSVDLPEHRAVARQAATEAMVLLRNDGLLPLDAERVHTMAVIGPNAERVQMMGGGSAALAPHYRIAPLDAIRAAFDRVDVGYERGCSIARRAEPIGPAHVTQPDGSPGFRAEYFAGTELDRGGVAPPGLRRRGVPHDRWPTPGRDGTVLDAGQRAVHAARRRDLPPVAGPGRRDRPPARGRGGGPRRRPGPVRRSGALRPAQLGVDGRRRADRRRSPRAAGRVLGAARGFSARRHPRRSDRRRRPT